MSIRALRGATTVDENSAAAILEATSELLTALMEANRIDPGQVLSATFSTTNDLDQAAPAEAARKLGWTEAALMCLQEMQVEGGLRRCVRARVLWDTGRSQSEMVHCYLRGASGLRPDLTDR